MLTEVAVLDALLQAHAADLGRDFVPYRNHAYRVVNLCVAFSSGDPAQLERIAVAAAFHDMGIWTAKTFDYLEPSVGLAVAYLKRSGRDGWIPEITAMILEHHKILPSTRGPHLLVEPFRRADWVDVSRGVVTFGLPSPVRREIFSTWPSAGFHQRLIKLTVSRLRMHPLSPLPMVRL